MLAMPALKPKPAESSPPPLGNDAATGNREINAAAVSQRKVNFSVFTFCAEELLCKRETKTITEIIPMLIWSGRNSGNNIQLSDKKNPVNASANKAGILPDAAIIYDIGSDIGSRYNPDPNVPKLRIL